MRRWILIFGLVLSGAFGCAPTKAELARWAAIHAAKAAEDERVGEAFIREWQKRNRPELETGELSLPPKGPMGLVEAVKGAAATGVAVGAAALGLSLSHQPWPSFFEPIQ
ncbi:MAG TPA: hypothetical protein VII38_16755 [Polyangia bacterium]